MELQLVPCSISLIAKPETFSLVRVENEHLGNADRYRVTREVPLPYAFEDVDDKANDSDEEQATSKKQNSPTGGDIGRRRRLLGRKSPKINTAPSRESFVEPNDSINKQASVRLASLEDGGIQPQVQPGSPTIK